MQTLFPPAASFRFPLLFLLSHVSPFMSKHLMFLFLCRFVHTGQDNLFLRGRAFDPSDIPFFIILRDDFLDCLFQFSKQQDIFRRCISDGNPLCSRSACTADSMNIVFQIAGNIIIENMSNPLYIKTRAAISDATSTCVLAFSNSRITWFR